MKESGQLYLVSTPIGNMEDITLRALRILKEVDIIFAEDTRYTGQLLYHYQIKKPLQSYHDHNERRQTETLLQCLEEGKKVALVTDSGTPGICDPGFKAVRAFLDHGGQPEMVPGACALVAALAGSGLATNEFFFGGFLPNKSGARDKRLQQLTERPETLIFYESPYRVVKTLEALKKIYGDRRIILARELTKKFEEFLRGTPEELIEHFKGRSPKGEFVVLIEGNRPEKNGK
jgi:16S rRNA (cytidine1402-2'-O)-methyltransferase